MAQGTWTQTFPSIVEHTVAHGADVNTRVDGLGSNYDMLPAPHDDGKKGFFEPCYVGDAILSGHSVNAEQTLNNEISTGVDSGAANAYVITMNIAPSVYLTGMKVAFVALNTNTGDSTVNIDGLGVVSIKASTSQELPADSIYAGDAIEIIYTGSFFQLTSTTANVASAANSAADSQQYAVGLPTEPTGYSSKTNRELSEAAAISAEASSVIALSSANFAGEWSTLSGAYTVPTSVLHNDAYWNLLSDTADITAIEPSVSSSYWSLIPLVINTQSNVMYYGATGDGVTDDTIAIQAAFDNADIDTIYFPKGSYFISSTITVSKDNTHVYGDGSGSVIIDTATTLNSHGIYNAGGFDGLRIADIKIMKQTALTTDKSACAIRVADHVGTGGADIVIERVEISGYNFGISCQSAIGPVTVRDCNIIVSTLVPAVSNCVNVNFATKCTVDNNVLDGNLLADHCVYVIHNQNLTVSNNTIVNAANSAIKALGTSGVPPWDIDRINVLNNSFDNNVFALQVTQDANTSIMKNIVVEKNVIYNSQNTSSAVGEIHVNLFKGDNVFITGNTIKDAPYGAIYVSADNSAGTYVNNLDIGGNTVIDWSMDAVGSHSCITIAHGNSSTEINAVVSGNFMDGNSNGRKAMESSGSGILSVVCDGNTMKNTTLSQGFEDGVEYSNNSWQNYNDNSVVGSNSPSITASGATVGYLKNANIFYLKELTGNIRYFSSTHVERWNFTGVTTSAGEYLKASLCVDINTGATSIVTGDVAATQSDAVAPLVTNSCGVVGFVEIPQNYAGGSLSGYTIYDVK